MHRLNKTVLSLSIYTFFLALLLQNNWLFIPAVGMFATAILSEILGNIYNNRTLPVKNIVPPIEEEQVVEEPKEQIRIIKIQREEDTELQEQKKALVRKAIDNGYKLIKEDFIPEELKS